MTTSDARGVMGTLWTAMTRTLRRAVLGKSCHDYMKQFAGSDAYWQEALAATPRSAQQPRSQGTKR